MLPIRRGWFPKGILGVLRVNYILIIPRAKRPMKSFLASYLKVNLPLWWPRKEHHVNLPSRRPAYSSRQLCAPAQQVILSRRELRTKARLLVLRRAWPFPLNLNTWESCVNHILCKGQGPYPKDSSLREICYIDVCRRKPVCPPFIYFASAFTSKFQQMIACSLPHWISDLLFCSSSYICFWVQIAQHPLKFPKHHKKSSQWKALRYVNCCYCS